VFFLKYIYQLPPSNYIVIIRIIIIGLLCVNASKEYYRFLIRREKELKINCFMVNLIVLTELFLMYKHGQGEFSHAYLTWEGYALLAALVGGVLLVLVKVTISDAINVIKKKVNKKMDRKQAAQNEAAKILKHE
jgi:CDP-diglyceride synthetase